MYFLIAMVKMLSNKIRPFTTDCNCLIEDVCFKSISPGGFQMTKFQCMYHLVTLLLLKPSDGLAILANISGQRGIGVVTPPL